MSAVSGRDFDVTVEWAEVGVLRDNMFALLYLMSTAPFFHLVMF